MADNPKVSRLTVGTEPDGGSTHPESAERADPNLLIRAPAVPCPSIEPTPNNCRECLAAIAHRLAQCTTALRGGIELALLGKHSGAEYVSILEESLQLADQMVQMIVSIRDLGESGSPAGPPESVALDPVVREVQRELREWADARDVRFRLSSMGTTQVSVNPGRLREAIQNLLAWVIANSAGGDFIESEISSSKGEVYLSLTLPRMDFQYLQIKVLEDIANPGLLFSQAAKGATMGWAINRRLIDGLGGKLEIVNEGVNTACIRVRLPAIPAT